MNKKHLSFICLLLIVPRFIFAHNISFGAGDPFYKDEFLVQDIFVNGKFDINENSRLGYELNWFRFNNIKISDVYSLDKLDLLVHNLAYKYEFSNQYIKSVDANLTWFNSFSGNGIINTSFASLEADPDFNKTVGGGLSAEFGWGMGLSGELIYCAPAINFKEDQIKGTGFVALLDLSKELDFSKSSIKFHAGTLYGAGKCKDNLDPAISGITQNYDITADFNLFSIFGLMNYELNINNFSLNLLSGTAYIPAMNYSYEIVRHLKFKNTWYRKIISQDEGNALQNNMFIPFVLDASYVIKGKYSFIPEFEKAFVIPINLNRNNQNSITSLDNDSLIKTLLLSGLTVRLSVLF